MKVQQNKLIPLSCILLMIVFGCTSVNAALYHFSQRGFEDGGYVTGSFSGEDVVGDYGENYQDIPDGKIKICNGRGCSERVYDDLHSFNIQFSGNSLFSSLNKLPGSGLFGLEYEIGTNSLTLGYGTSYDSSQYSIESFGYLKYNDEGWIPYSIRSPEGRLIQLNFSTTEPLVVTQVPLPSAFLLFASAFVMIFRRFKAIKS